MSRILVCIDCGTMGTTPPVECKATAEEIEGENEFAINMVERMGFVYLGCPACKSPNVFLQPVDSVTEAPLEEKSQPQSVTIEGESDADVYVGDMVDEDEEDEEVVEAPKPTVRKKKKKKKKGQLRARRRIGADGIETEYVEDTTVSTDDGVEDLEFKRGPPQPRKMYRRECKNPNCGRDFETKHSMVGYCPKCLKRFTGG